MRRIVRALVRSHPAVHRAARSLYASAEKRYTRYRRRNELTPQMEAVVCQLRPQLRGLRPTGPRVLFVSTRGFNVHQLMDGVIAHGLRLRGADVDFYTCGGGLDLCDLAIESRGLTPTHCDYCSDCSVRTIRAFDNRMFTLRTQMKESELQAWAERASQIEDPEHFEYRGLPIGELVRVSVHYIIRMGVIPQTEKVHGYYQRVVASACMLVDAYERLLDQRQPDRIVMLNGRWYPERIMLELARRRGITATTYETGMRPDTLSFAHNTITSFYELSPEWEYFARTPLTSDQAAELDAYVTARSRGKGGHERIWASMLSDLDEIRKRLEIPEGARVFTAFTNVLSDSSVIGRDRSFNGLVHWLKETIRYFGEHRPDDVLLLRVHPAEALSWVGTDQSVLDELADFPMPPNLRIIPPQDTISSYVLAAMSDAGLVYTTTIGLEMALMGKQVLVAGRTHYDRRGFTRSADTAEEYLAWLKPGALPAALTSEELELARRYAYTLFFRYQVGFPWVTMPAPAQPLVHLEQPARLLPGTDAEFDLLCQAILEGRDVLSLRREREERVAAAA